MRKILVSLIAVILLCSMAVSVSADWNNPFRDVKESHWFYDAVKTTVEKGIFNGMTEDTFQPNGKMTRAMFMTTLANMVGAEVGEYTGMPFTDVKASHWYAPYIQWAYDNGISSGMSADRFGVNDPITREQMVTLFYNTAAKFGADTTVTDTYKFDKTYDAEKIREYAVEPMKWAMQNSIISGSGVNGNEIVVDPWGTATRAQAAQIITMYLAYTEKDMPAVTDLTINGNPIENYTIVYGESNPYVKDVQNAAKDLQGYIENATGITLDITNDSQEPEGCEILVGVTNRESMGLVSVDRDGEGIESFEISVQGNFVVIAGKSDEERHDGTLFGVYGFAKEILEAEFLTPDVSVYNVIRNKNVPDGYVFKDSPGYEYRIVYWNGVADELGTGGPFRTTGIMHNMWKLVGFGDASSAEPCYSDENNLATIEKNFLGMLYDGLDSIWVTQNDTTEVCTCSKCQATYRSDGGRAATLMRLMNRLAKAAEDAGYGDVEIWTYAYSYSFKPVNFKLDDQVVIYFAPITGCAGHPYNNDCKLNKVVSNNLEGWDEITKKIYTWDYSTNFFYSFTPMPLTKTFRENKNWFYEHGVRGEFNNAIADDIGEFGELKAYLIAVLQWDPTMDEATYRAKIARFLEVYYGAGGKYINQYIQLTEELSDPNCFGYNTVHSSVIASDVVLANAEKIDAMWDAAEALCENEEQYLRIRKSRISWTYMYLDALYNMTYAKGTDAQRAEYEKLATEFYEEAMSFDIAWAERSSTVVHFDPTKSVSTWAKWD
ncbi:MAG: DUF4838 domain-containing protein [Clostridia bacterium]|nr:DUF4838 domain-containing protein [Clostridia bacterium]